MEGINTVIRNNNGELQYIITEMQADRLTKEETIFRLSMILASSRTLQILTRQPKVGELKVTAAPAPKTKEPLPQQVAAVEDDNPEQEDKDVKKQREEQRNFFG